MTAIAKFLARKIPGTATEADVLRQAALFCCAGLFVFVLLKTYGLDLSPGLFE
jgi:hypothetical protein